MFVFFLFSSHLFAEKKVVEYSTALAMCANWIEAQVTVCAPLGFLGN